MDEAERESLSNDIVDKVQTDVDGFLREGDQWNDRVAFELAAAAGIRTLSSAHWAVIGALRAGYVAG
jgi:sulfur relay (sulfurtransferase) DsrC/TusE family protein